MTLHLKVKPGSRVDQLVYPAAEPGQERTLVVKLKAPAQDGKANAHLIEFLAKQFGITKSSITLVSGFTNPHKRLEIDADELVIQSKLAAL